MKNIINNIKQRQWWRPVAPVVLLEDINEWFENGRESPFMLATFKVRENYASQIPAVTHNDLSARVQTVTKQENTDLYELISAFKHKTGIPILCNTSLNDRGEPIINTADQAINFALRKKIGIVYINKKRISLKCFDKFKNSKPASRDCSIFPQNIGMGRSFMFTEEIINPFYTKKSVIDILTNTDILYRYNLGDLNQVKKLCDELKQLTNNSKWDKSYNTK